MARMQTGIVGISIVVAAFVLPSGILYAQREPADEGYYAITSPRDYDADAAFVRHWLDETLRVMQAKYGVRPVDYFITVRLLAEPSADIDVVRSGSFRCCATSGSGKRTGIISLLTRSAPVWNADEVKSSLGLSKKGDDYHAKVIVAEYIPVGHLATQATRPSGGWAYYSAPAWFVQGLQEYDAIFHSTNTNAAETVRLLDRWARRNRSVFSCCEAGLTISNATNGGATFLRFLADLFGEDIHARILRNPAATFGEAFAAETRPHSTAELFRRFETWLADR